jgi:hypothetical protein
VKVEQQEVKVTKTKALSEVVGEALEHYNGAAAILIPDGDQGMRVIYRSGRAGGGGAWWEASYGDRDTSGPLDYLLRDTQRAFLIAREEVDALLNDDLFITDGKDL